MKDVFITTVLSCLLLCAITSSIDIIIITFTFILLLLITSQIVFILIIITIIVIIKINPPFSLSKLIKLCLKVGTQ